MVLRIMVPLNPLNAELNPIFHLLTLLGAHHILHVSRIRVNHVAGCPRISRDHLRGFLMLIPRICYTMNHRENFRYSVCV